MTHDATHIGEGLFLCQIEHHGYVVEGIAEDPRYAIQLARLKLAIAVGPEDEVPVPLEADKNVCCHAE